MIERQYPSKLLGILEVVRNLTVYMEDCIETIRKTVTPING